jgi:tetratricopeptide (TPR) repeat protein
LPPELRAKIDVAILEGEPARATAVLRQARRLASEGRVEEARTMMKQALDHDPTNIDLWVAIIQEHLKEGDAETAGSMLASARSKGLEGRALIETQARIEAAQDQVDEMRATVTRLRGQARGDAALIARSFLLEGQLEGSLGNIDEALAAYGAADMAQPQTPALEYAAQLALRSGRPTYALGIYRTLCNRDPGGSACERETQLSRELGKASRNQPIP